MCGYRIVQGDSDVQDEEGLPQALFQYFPAEQLQALQDMFAQTHQLALVIADLEGNWITTLSNENAVCQLLQQAEKARERCMLTYQMVTSSINENSAPTWHECFNCGLVEGGAPVWVQGRHVANCLAGQNNGLQVSSQRIEEYAWSMGVDVAQVRNAYALLPVIPVEQFTSQMNLFAAFVSQILEQAYREHQLQAAVQRLRQQEDSLRHEGIASVRANRMLRESIQRVGRDLQEALRYVSQVANEYDRIALPGQHEAAEQMLADMVQKIRRAYRTALDGMALEQAQRSEMEKILYDSLPILRHRWLGRRFEGLLPAAEPDGKQSRDAGAHARGAREEL